MSWGPLLDLVKKFFEQYWPGFAVAFWNYEEAKIDHEQKEKEAAELALKNLQDEKVIRDGMAGKSDDDVINELAGTDPNSKPKS